MNMKARYILILMLVALSTSIMAQDSTKVDENNGFKYYKFGDKLIQYLSAKSFSDFYFVNDQHVVKIPGGNNSIGTIPVKWVNLYFIDSLLSKIEVVVSNENNVELVKACRRVFGDPDTVKYKDDVEGSLPDKVEKECFWHGKNIYLYYKDMNKKELSSEEQKYRNANKLSVSLVYQLKDYEELLKKVRLPQQKTPENGTSTNTGSDF